MINNYNYKYQHYKQYKLLYEMFLFLLGYYCLQKNDINFMEFSMGLYILNQYYYIKKFLKLLKSLKFLNKNKKMLKTIVKVQNKYLLHY